MSRVSSYEAAVFDIGGSSLLGDLKSVEVESSAMLADVTPVVSAGMEQEPVRQWVRLGGVLGSTKAGGARVTALDAGPIVVGGTPLTEYVSGVKFIGSMQLEDASGVGDAWRHPVTVRKHYQAEVQAIVDTLASRDVIGRAYSSLVDRKVVLEVSIAGIVVALPMVIDSVGHVVTAGKVQTWAIKLSGSAPGGQAYPSSPTGVANLLAWSFNAPELPLGVSITTRSLSGLAYSGSFLVEQFEFEIVSGKPVDTAYVFASRGPVAAGAT